MRASLLTGFLSGIILISAGCRPQVRAIHIGEDTCEHCMMTISDERFASQIVTQTGRTSVFDSIECLVGYLVTGGVADNDLHGLWVTDFADPERMIRAEEATYLRSDRLPSPMGLNLTAFAEPNSARKMQDAYGGETLSWIEVRRMVETEPVEPATVAVPAVHLEH